MSKIFNYYNKINNKLEVDMPNTEIKNILESINDNVQDKEKYDQIIE